MILDDANKAMAQKLLVSDVNFVASVFGVVFSSAIDNFTALIALNSAIMAQQFANPFSSPAMSTANFESKDEKITDNHEWTVLDSSFPFCVQKRKHTAASLKLKV